MNIFRMLAAVPALVASDVFKVIGFTIAGGNLSPLNHRRKS